MSPTAAVTGAAGFVGSRIVGDLSRAGWTIQAITSRAADVQPRDRVRVVECSWSPDGIKRGIAGIEGIDVWIHAAARLPVDDHSGIDLYRDNVLLTDALAKHVSSSSSTSQFVFLSSVSVYGSGISEVGKSWPEPDTHYGCSKLLAERAVESRLGDRSLSLRLAGVWGSEPFPKLFINRCLNLARDGKPIDVEFRGEGRRNYIWVGDLPSVVIQAVDAWKPGVCNVAGPEALSLQEMIRWMAESFGVKATFGNVAKNHSEKDQVFDNARPYPLTTFRDALGIERGPL